MKIEHVSAGANPNSQHNDDHIAVFTCADVSDIIVIDGGSSVAERDYIDEVRGDVAWFVHAFTDSLQKILIPGRDQPDCVRMASADVRAQFMHLTDGRDVPVHAWPIAAMTWLRISHHDEAAHATLYCLGDCKTLLYTTSGPCIDLDPFVNPQEAVLQDVIAKLTADGIADPASRREQMLPMLRARRESQNLAPAPGVLCLDPNGPFHARLHSVELTHDASVLVMTDGFYRLVDLYGLYTNATLVEACITHGLKAQLDKLRNYEATSARTAERAVKASDDASAAIWTTS
ncbi:hypothetical protein HD842_001270 [Massilia aurea]|uniref:PPM-type phosphatase domain-containing protein n=1 Tax=Massilia aurea TaxID=373040 RepID=A0A7W9WYH8_9BURK|nr:hypothetical protein [Massilia aurea]MBB6133159.1 hypothetical protein [Massilia aurea]